MSKTKAELEAEIRELKQQLSDQSKQEQYDQFGKEMMGLYQGFINAGFEPETALDLMKLCIIKAPK